MQRLPNSQYTQQHEIGLHTSYNTYRDATQTAKEFQQLKRICEQERIHQEQWGGRQHFLRWETPTTFRNWNEAGLDYDTTLSYADHAGFRCGTCYEYPVYDVVKCQSLKLRERPLIAMEGSVINKCYMGLGATEEALGLFQQLKATCQQFQGEVTLLWHNHRLINPTERALYEALL